MYVHYKPSYKNMEESTNIFSLTQDKYLNYIIFNITNLTHRTYKHELFWLLTWNNELHE